MSSADFGAAGERAAASYLERIGWRMIAKNVRIGHGELDIIAMDGDDLVVAEVRTRNIGEMLPPEATVGPRKLNSLIKTARKYVERSYYGGNWRIDIVAVTVDRDGKHHIELFSDVTMGTRGGGWG